MGNQHAYKRIEKDINEGAIRNVVLLYGKEQYLIKWAVGVITKKYINDTYKVFDFYELEPGDATLSGIIEGCETLSMFSDKRIVYLHDFPVISGNRLKNFSESDETALAGYIRKIPDTCLLIISAEKVERKRKLYKEIVSYGGAYDFDPLDDITLKDFIKKRFKKSGKKIGAGEVEELVSLSGYHHKGDYTLFNLENDIKKIAAHADSEKIQPRDILEVVSGDIEIDIFAMIDAACRGKKDKAFKLLHNLLSSGESVFRVLPLLCAQFEILLEVKELLDEGKTTRQASEILKAHEFRVKMAASASGTYSTDRLKEILKKAYQVEETIKSGFMDGVLALEVLIAEV